MPDMNPDFYNSAKNIWTLEEETLNNRIFMASQRQSCNFLWSCCLQTPPLCSDVFFFLFCSSHPSLPQSCCLWSSVLCALLFCLLLSLLKYFSFCLLPSSAVLFSLIRTLLSFDVHVIPVSALICLLPPLTALWSSSASPSPVFSCLTCLLSFSAVSGRLAFTSQLLAAASTISAGGQRVLDLWNPVSTFVFLRMTLMHCTVHSWLLPSPMLNTRDRQNVLSGRIRNLESCFWDCQRCRFTVMWLCPCASDLLYVCVYVGSSVCGCCVFLFVWTSACLDFLE